MKEDQERMEKKMWEKERKKEVERRNGKEGEMLMNEKRVMNVNIEQKKGEWQCGMIERKKSRE